MNLTPFRSGKGAGLVKLTQPTALKRSEDLVQELRREGIALVEMCGRAGDVFLMDMRVLHTPSINSTRHPRMMATCRCLIG